MNSKIWNKLKKKKGGVATGGIANIQIHAINAGIYYGELLNQKVVVLANREPFTKNILQGALGMRSMFAYLITIFQLLQK